VAKCLRIWLTATGAKTLYIEPGSPWENGYCESFNSKLRDEFLNGEIFYSLKELRVLAERWRVQYNTIRPHSSLGYRPPCADSMATPNFSGVWKSEKQKALPTFPYPRLRRRVLSFTRRATLTITLIQNIGQANSVRERLHKFNYRVQLA
jgi:putative transposase